MTENDHWLDKFQHLIPLTRLNSVNDTSFGELVAFIQPRDTLLLTI